MEFKHITREKARRILNVSKLPDRKMCSDIYTLYCEEDNCNKVYRITDKQIGSGRNGTAYLTCLKNKCGYVSKWIPFKKENDKEKYLKEAHIQYKCSKKGIAPEIYQVLVCPEGMIIIMEKLVKTLGKEFRELNNEQLEEAFTKILKDNEVDYEYEKTNDKLECLNELLGKYPKISVDDSEYTKIKRKQYVDKAISVIEKLHDLGYIHYDVHLENFMIDDNDNVKLIDFGRTKELDFKNLSRLDDDFTRLSISIDNKITRMGRNNLKYLDEYVETYLKGLRLIALQRSPDIYRTPKTIYEVDDDYVLSKLKDEMRPIKTNMMVDINDEELDMKDITIPKLNINFDMPIHPNALIGTLAKGIRFENFIRKYEPDLQKVISQYKAGNLNEKMRKRSFNDVNLMDLIFFHPLCPRTPNDMVLYRGVTTSEFLNGITCIDNNRNNCIFVDSSCLSTSYDIDVAQKFQRLSGMVKHNVYRLKEECKVASDNNIYLLNIQRSNISRHFNTVIRKIPFIEAEKKMLLKIYVPKGTPYILGDISEKEIILPAGLGCVLYDKYAAVILTENGETKFINTVDMFAQFNKSKYGFISYPQEIRNKWYENTLNRLRERYYPSVERIKEYMDNEDIELNKIFKELKQLRV